MRHVILYIIGFLLSATCLQAQPVCSDNGHTPSSPVSICGNGTYSRSPSSVCFNKSFFLPGCTNSFTNYGDLNPVYFKFTCKTSGTFGFVIAAWKPEEDLNWQLFDITGKNPLEIYTDRNLTIAANWSGTPGPTGASNAGSSLIQCRTIVGQGSPGNTFCRMPTLTENHTYLLMVGNSTAPGAFALTIGGGTADISGTTGEDINVSVASCDNKQLLLKFNKKIRCSSIAADGSDFNLSPATGTITSAVSVQCSNTSETDSILLTFANPLPVGSYTLTIKKGNDNNTLTDQCSNNITDPTQLNFRAYPFASLDTIFPAGCEPVKLKIKLTKPVRCSSVASDGSDFIITGPTAVTITGITTFCSSTFLTDSLELQLLQPISTAGSYSIAIKNGSDGNTLVDDCNFVTPAGNSKGVTIKGMVDANFSFAVKEGCIADTLLFNHPGGNDVNSWSWTVDTINSSLQQPVILINRGGNVLAELYVSNGLCSAVAQQIFALKPKLFIDFTAPDSTCADEPVLIVNESRNAVDWFWDFGNNTTSTVQNPPLPSYSITDVDKRYTISLTAVKENCSITKTHELLVEASCNIAMPNAFTPNGDGLNDVFQPLKTSGVTGLQLMIYNRYGQLLFTSSGNNIQWNGMLNGVAQPAGLYSWQLTYTDRKTAKQILRKGTVMLLR